MIIGGQAVLVHGEPRLTKAIERAIEIKLGEVAVKFASLEDVVIHKIIARRARDIEDVITIPLKNPDYNRKYIRKWLLEFDKSLEEDFTETFDGLEEQIKHR